jgi:hypothetical protein
VKRLTSDDRNDKSRGFAPAERNVEGEPVGPSFEGVVGEGTLSRRRMLGLAGGALAGVLLTPLSLSGGEASANQVSPSLKTPAGTYYIRQRSNGRFLDAYDYGVDYRVVTRTFQNDDTQRWLFDRYQSGTVTYYRIRQKSTGRYLDAYTSSNDYAVVTRTFQNDDTQRWLLTQYQSGTATYYRIRQKSTGRYLDAHEYSGADYAVVTRTFQDNDTQRWLRTPA